MCGIAGIVGNVGSAQARAWIEAMTRRLSHRGPDGQGTWVGDGAALGQTRLSIIDLTNNGRQPMASVDQSLQLVCNGEIYNYRQLRRELLGEGATFSSETDVETLLPLYGRHGDRLVDHLVGMFAFGLWDVPRKRLLLGRDRIGEKPLFYAERDGILAFASEIKALLTLPWLDRAIDEEAVTHLFAYQSLPSPFTIYRGIRQLPPAGTLVWQSGRSELARYWNVDFSRPAEAWSRDSALDTYGRLMRQAVTGQLVADVPVGVMLSGGIDSTTVARFAREQDAGVRTFCIGSPTEARADDEHERASLAASVLGTAHKNVSFSAFGLKDMVRVLAHYDQPCSSFVTLYADSLAREIRREVKVVLTGNGADEVFAGYAAYPRLAPLDTVRRIAAPLTPWLGALPDNWRSSRAMQFIAQSRADAAEMRGLALTMASRRLMPHLVTDAFLARWRDAEPGQVAAAAARASKARSMLQATTISDLMVCHQHGHCLIPDMSGMSHGLEMRSPFLDHRVVEFAMSLQPALTVGRLGRASDAKLIAKEHLRQVMPSALVDARKIGFGYGIPLDQLVRQKWRGPIEALLLEGSYLELGIFSREGVRWALGTSYFATCLLISFAVFAEVSLRGRTYDDVADKIVGSCAA